MAATPILSEPFNGQSFFIQSNDEQHRAARPREGPRFHSIRREHRARRRARRVERAVVNVTPSEPGRPPNVAGVRALLLVAVAAVAGYLPARRAAHIDPVETLRRNSERSSWRRVLSNVFLAIAHRRSTGIGMRYWLLPVSLCVSASANAADRTGGAEASADIQPRTVTDAHQIEQEAVGISYMLTLGHLPLTGFLSEFADAFTADVVFAAGRGRLNVVEVDQAVGATDDRRRGRLASVGEYYLFDHTGFILVRPATRTFSSYVFTEASYTENPSIAGVPFARFDQVATDDVILMQHAPVDIYWHADNASGQILGGHLAIDDAPLSELSVAVSFGATRGLADVVSSDGAVPLVRSSQSRLRPTSTYRAKTASAVTS